MYTINRVHTYIHVCHVMCTQLATTGTPLHSSALPSSFPLLLFWASSCCCCNNFSTCSLKYVFSMLNDAFKEDSNPYDLLLLVVLMVLLMVVAALPLSSFIAFPPLLLLLLLLAILSKLFFLATGGGISEGHHNFDA